MYSFTRYRFSITNHQTSAKYLTTVKTSLSIVSYLDSASDNQNDRNIMILSFTWYFEPVSVPVDISLS
jgi:hypothetical protein